MVYKLIFNETEIVFETWKELQTYLYTLDQNKKRTKKKTDELVYRVVTSEPFRIEFDS